MNKEQRLTRIASAYTRIVKLWTDKNIAPPPVQVKEVAREAGIQNPATAANDLFGEEILIGQRGPYRTKLSLVSAEGDSVDSLVEDYASFAEAAKASAPYKRAVQEAAYRSRLPGGGPVIKRRINSKSLKRKKVELGKARLQIVPQTYSVEEERETQRAAKKAELRRRAEKQAEVEGNPVLAKLARAFSLIKKLSESSGVVNQAEIRERLKTNIEKDQTQILLAIWGPPYERQGNDKIFDSGSPEEEMAQALINVVNRVNKLVKTKLVILYADFYGTEINNMDRETVSKYGKQIRKRFADAEFICWSKLRRENSPNYQFYLEQLENSTSRPTKEEVKRALIMQNKIGKTPTLQQAEAAAKKYKQERTIEGRILTAGFVWNNQQYDNIIKIGTAPSKDNDNPYEPQLPRFYVAGMPRAAWNTPRKEKPNEQY